MFSYADLLVFQTAHPERGPDAAMAEMRRCGPIIAENAIEQTLERILASPDVPHSEVAQWGSQAKELIRWLVGNLAGGSAHDP